MAPRKPPTPAQPGPIAVKGSQIWDAVVSDVALHGFVYLGVLLTFVGVLGFLLFAFVDVPDEAQPFVELFIVLIFFGWAWALRRQQAVRVAAGMDLIAKLLLPLILFASLVDNADFPPDFVGNGLVVALTVTAFLTAGAYAWFGARNPESSLRYLVAPLLWLSGMTLGFFFKSDEVLTSDAITRLVSAQPALVSAVIALTLAAGAWKPDHRFAAPTMRSALVGLPVAYLLTISFAVGEDWAHPWTLVVLRIATVASAEILARWYDQQRLLSVLRPWLLAGVIAPLVPAWDVGWAGVIAAGAYVALLEWTARNDRDVLPGLSLAAGGTLVGVGMSLFEPLSALLAFGAISVWAHRRRLVPGPFAGVVLPVTAATGGDRFRPLGPAGGLRCLACHCRHTGCGHSLESAAEIRR